MEEKKPFEENTGTEAVGKSTKTGMFIADYHHRIYQSHQKSKKKQFRKEQVKKGYAENYRRETERIRLEIAKEKEEMERNREKELEAARLSAKRLVEQVRAESQKLIDEIIETKKAAEAESSADMAARARAQMKTGIARIQDIADPIAAKDSGYKLPRNLVRGDTVRINGMSKDGTLVGLPDGAGYCLVQTGIVKSKVHISELRLIENSKTKKNTLGGGSVTKNIESASKRKAASEVDLRGMDVEQGLLEMDRFIDEWGFDGLKLDGQHLNCCLPDHNHHSHLEYPEESVEKLPEFFQGIFDRAREIKPYSVVQICPCGCAMNFFLTPHMNQAVASDPTSSAQIRMKRKVYGAMVPDMAYYADHIELSDEANDYGTQIGIGGVIGSKFTWPKPNPNVKGDGYLLTPEKEAALKKWVGIYNDKMLSTGEYLNLYDIRFDVPETHVVAKDGALYYAFYAEAWDGGQIELRGLEAGKTYTVTEYASDDLKTYTVEGSNPYITPSFERDYLIEVAPAE